MTIDKIAAFDGQVAKIEGSVSTGKTEALIARAAKLLEEGVAGSDIMLVACTAIAANEAAKRLAERAGSKADDVRICTPLQACVSVLGTEDARAFTGRTPRILTPFEYNFFLEDMKTLGQSLKQLRSMLRFYDRQFCGFDQEEDWLEPGEKTVVLEHARKLLTLEGAMLESEAPYLCGRYLTQAGDKAADLKYAYVLADDFQNLTKAEQTCICLLAKNQLLVTGNAFEQTDCGSAYANPEGFVKFDTMRDGVDVFTLQKAYGNPDVTEMADAILYNADNNAPYAVEREGDLEDITYVKWNTPEDEFNGISRYLRYTVNEGDLVEGTVCVVAPNKRWAKTLDKMLRKRGFKTSLAGAFGGITGDPRETARCQALIAYTKLNLLTDPDDAVAWRAWCGYGNSLTNSDAWDQLLGYIDEHGLGVVEALAQVAAEVADGKQPFAKAEVLAERYTEGRDFIEKSANRKGFALLKAIGFDKLPEFADICNSAAGDEDAATLYRMTRTQELDPVYPDDIHTMRISSYKAMAGCNYDIVVCPACVDGFMPTRDAFEAASTEEDRAAVMGDDRRLFSAAIGKAARGLVLSYFTKSDLELAEKTKMQVVRVRSDNGQRVALIRPTCFIAEAGSSAPSPIGGQALLASL